MRPEKRTMDHGAWDEKKVFASLGAGAVVLCGGYVPLVRLNYSAWKGRWVLPGGLVESGEHPSLAAQREVFEETGLRVALTCLLAVRHRVNRDGSANVYWVFRATMAADRTERGAAFGLPELSWPEKEIMEARFWPLAEALRAPDVMPNTRRFLALAEESMDRSCFTFDSGVDEAFDDELYGYPPSKPGQE